jgi:hypothetical protein
MDSERMVPYLVKSGFPLLLGSTLFASYASTYPGSKMTLFTCSFSAARATFLPAPLFFIFLCLSLLSVTGAFAFYVT